MFVGVGYAYGDHPVSGLNGYVVPHVVIHETTEMTMTVELIDMYSCIYCTDDTKSASLYPSSANTVEAVGGLVFDSGNIFSIEC